MMTQRTYDAFLSYSHRDADIVLAIANELRAYGLKIFLDILSLRLGDILPREIEEALSNSKCGIVFFSESASNSDWCRTEYDRMLSQAIDDKSFRLIPVKLDATRLPGFAKDRLYFDLSTPEQTNISAFCQKVLTALDIITASHEKPSSIPPSMPEILSARILFMLDALKLSEEPSRQLKEIAGLLMMPDCSITKVGSCRCGGDLLYGSIDLGGVDYYDNNFYICSGCFVHCQCEEYTGTGQESESFGKGKCSVGCNKMLEQYSARKNSSVNE